MVQGTIDMSKGCPGAWMYDGAYNSPASGGYGQDRLNAVRFNCRGTFTKGTISFLAGSSYLQQLLGW
mgnify:CR=1 FL=1